MISAVRVALMHIAAALLSAIRAFWAGVSVADVDCVEVSGVVARVFMLFIVWVCREESCM